VQQSFGRYRLVRHLATGGMGEVYLAEAVGAAGFAKRMVIKTLRPDLSADERLVAQFVAEGRLLEALDHPNIAQILDLGMYEGTYFLAMEYVQGRDLRDLRNALPMRDGLQRMDEVPVLTVMADIAGALEHAAGRLGADGEPMHIVHHDVTPSNIMVRRDGHVKLVDFGVARSAVWRRLEASALRGKLPYLSPEQASLTDADGRADVFSLGLVAYELLSGRKAMAVNEPEELPAAYERLTERLDELSDVDVSSSTRQLIAHMVRLDRRDRIAGAALVAERARHRLVELGIADTARPLALALAPSFDLLEQQATGFDHTLASLVAAGPGSIGTPVEGGGAGTVSMPGLQGLAGPVVEAPALVSATGTIPPVGASRPRKRVLFGAAMLLLLAGLIGWWVGTSGTTTPPATTAAATQVPDATPAPAAPPAPVTAVALTTAPTPASPPPAPAPTPVEVTVAVAAAPTADEPDAAASDTTSPPAAESAAPVRAATATLRFLVFPAYCEVLVDGRRQAVHASGRYALSLRPGRHKVVVRDPTSGQQQSQTVTLGAGESRTLPGGFRLVTDLP